MWKAKLSAPIFVHFIQANKIFMILKTTVNTSDTYCKLCLCTRQPLCYNMHRLFLTLFAICWAMDKAIICMHSFWDVYFSVFFVIQVFRSRNETVWKYKSCNLHLHNGLSALNSVLQESKCYEELTGTFSCY